MNGLRMPMKLPIAENSPCILKIEKKKQMLDTMTMNAVRPHLK